MQKQFHAIKTRLLQQRCLLYDKHSSLLIYPDLLTTSLRIGPSKGRKEGGGRAFLSFLLSIPPIAYEKPDTQAKNKIIN